MQALSVQSATNEALGTSRTSPWTSKVAMPAPKRMPTTRLGAILRVSHVTSAVSMPKPASASVTSAPQSARSHGWMGAKLEAGCERRREGRRDGHDDERRRQHDHFHGARRQKREAVRLHGEHVLAEAALEFGRQEDGDEDDEQHGEPAAVQEQGADERLGRGARGHERRRLGRVLVVARVGAVSGGDPDVDAACAGCASRLQRIEVGRARDVGHERGGYHRHAHDDAQHDPQRLAVDEPVQVHPQDISHGTQPPSSLRRTPPGRACARTARSRRCPPR